jgi:cytochrome c2
MLKHLVDEQRAPAATSAPAMIAEPAVERDERAVELIARYQCNRCHDGTPSPAAHPSRDCVRCHRAIRAGTFRAPAAALARWQRKIHSLPVAPNLRHSGARLRRNWVAAFLHRPHDVRPHLAASMPRLALGTGDAEVLAEHLVPDDDRTVATVEGNCDEGLRRYVALRCARCHRFSGAPLPEAHRGPAELGVGARALQGDAVTLATDLAYARERIQPGKLVAWLRDPAALAPGTLMPPHGLDERAASDLAAFLLTIPLVPEPSPALTARLAPLERLVRWDEVFERVFGKVCWHCHSTPDYARGDGGPGYSGGFGFSARGLDLSSYEGIASGSIGDDGRRRSVFAPLADGTPRLVVHLRARVDAEARGESPAIRGMPLGFPALSAQEIQLVETWVVQGRPR